MRLSIRRDASEPLAAQRMSSKQPNVKRLARDRDRRRPV
jgi:hypothetical protein